MFALWSEVFDRIIDRIVTMIHLATIAELIDDEVEVGVGLV